MANVTPKTCANVFYKARCAAAAHNEQLSSREGAAEIMAIDRGRIYRIESGTTIPYPEEVHLMADLYNASELRNYYCRNCCPLGKDIPEIDMDTLDRITLRALDSLRKVEKTKENLLDIAADGIISEDERPTLDKILCELDELSAIAQNLRVWVEKNA